MQVPCCCSSAPNLNDLSDHLRGFGSGQPVGGVRVVVAALIYRGMWGRGMFGTLLVLLWCLPPLLQMAASKFTFETRKQAVLRAEGAGVKDLDSISSPATRPLR